MTVSEYSIQGLRKFALELGRVSDDLPKSLRDFNVKAAAEVVKTGRSLAHTPQASKAAKSLRSSRSASYVAVLLGDNRRYAFARGAEWGSRQYKQFPPWRGNQHMNWGGGPGYFLHPAIRMVGETVLEQYWESIRDLRARAFPE